MNWDMYADNDASQHESDDTTIPPQEEEQETAPSHDATSPPEQHLHGWRAWLAWPFIPRFPSESQETNDENEEEDDVQDVEMAVPMTPKCDNDEERCRVVSEDYTAATAASTGDFSSPPNSPGQTFDVDELVGVEVKQLPNDDE